MLNGIIHFFSGKELILYNPHRNSAPLVNSVNRKSYVFISAVPIWKLTGVAGRNSRLRYRLLSLFLSFIYPRFIIGINWTQKRDTLFRLWCNRNQRHFIVLQHGAYSGGVLRDINEKYVNCNIFLVWSDYFKKIVDQNNSGKAYQSIVFGNTCYNDYSRVGFTYREPTGSKILVVPSLIEGVRLTRLRELISKLRNLNFDITVKEHSYQPRFSETIDQKALYKGEKSLYDLLRDQEFDYVIADVSTSLLDAIFFKNNVIYFSPDDQTLRNENMYVKYMRNLTDDLKRITGAKFIREYVDIEAQEKLLDLLIKTENTSNDLNLISEKMHNGLGKEMVRSQKKVTIHSQ